MDSSKRETSWDSQGRNQDQDGHGGDYEKWYNSGCILKIGPTALDSKVDMVFEGTRKS